MAFSGSSITSISPGSSHSWVGLTNVVRAALSQEIRFQAQPLLRFAQFAQRKTELGVQPGKTIDMLAFSNLSLGGALTEGTHIETKALSTSTMSITVAEYGNAVALTEFLLRASTTELLEVGGRLLAQDVAKVTDIAVRRALDAGTYATIYGGTATARTTVGGFTSSAKLTMAHVRDAVATLANAKTPKYVSPDGREAYVMLTHPNVIRTLKDDALWQSANEYAGSEAIFRGEVGRFDDVVFVQTTMCPIVRAASASVLVDNAVITGESDATNAAAVACHKSYLIGGDSVGLAHALEPEIREDGVRDFGRERAIAWYSIMGAKALDFGSLVKVVRLESYSSLQPT